MENGQNGQNDENNDDKKNGELKLSVIICMILVFAIIILFAYVRDKIDETQNVEISYGEFLEKLEDGKLESVVIEGDRLILTPKESKKKNKNEVSDEPMTYYTGVMDDPELVERLNKAYKDNKLEFKMKLESQSSKMFDIMMSIIPLGLTVLMVVLAWKMVTKGGGMMGVGKSNAKIYVENETGVTFKDVAGQEEAKESLTELVDFLHNPTKYTEIGAKLPKGALLVGPPGTGKTLLAKAVAGEAKVPFFSLSGSNFVEMFVGVGASRVRDLFKEAQQKAPCIIFIDEVDAIGKSRDTQHGNGNDEREQTLNQLLAEMDGFDTSKGLVVLAATNRPEVLDKALLRPGRFDRRIIVDKPDLKGRIDILKVHSKDVLLDETVDLHDIALATSGAVGSDLANIINEAAIMAVKAGRKFVTQEDLFESVEVVIAGKEKKDRILGKEEKKIVAYHEVGHALITAVEKNSEPVQKITIVPRTMGALGYVMQVPEEEKYLMSKAEILTRIRTLFGGRAAEKVIFDSITTGASNDIEKATKLKEEETSTQTVQKSEEQNTETKNKEEQIENNSNKKEPTKTNSNKTTETSKGTPKNNAPSNSNNNGSGNTNNSVKQEEKPVVVQKQPWEELGLTEDQYKNQPMYSWEEVDFKTKDECMNYGNEHAEYGFECSEVTSWTRSLGWDYKTF